MDNKEKELVTLTEVFNKNCYNKIEGGRHAGYLEHLRQIRKFTKE